MSVVKLCLLYAIGLGPGQVIFSKGQFMGVDLRTAINHSCHAILHQGFARLVCQRSATLAFID